MKKELPNPRNKDVIHPDMDYPYFEGAEDFPLEPDQLEYSPVNAWWFAEFSFLAYCPPDFVRRRVRQAGFDGFRVLSGKRTECMISWNQDVSIVAFRGTELKSRSMWHEVKTDLYALPVNFDCGGKVHGGFLDGKGAVRDDRPGSFMDKFENLIKRSLKIFGWGLADHPPIFYALKTWNALISEKDSL